MAVRASYSQDLGHGPSARLNVLAFSVACVTLFNGGGPRFSLDNGTQLSSHPHCQYEYR